MLEQHLSVAIITDTRFSCNLGRLPIIIIIISNYSLLFERDKIIEATYPSKFS